MSDEDAIRFWMRELGAGRAELLEAVRAVGTSARLVAKYLDQGGSKG